jgi:hypothetical protein
MGERRVDLRSNGVEYFSMARRGSAPTGPTQRSHAVHLEFNAVAIAPCGRRLPAIDDGLTQFLLIALAAQTFPFSFRALRTAWHHIRLSSAAVNVQRGPHDPAWGLNMHTTEIRQAWSDLFPASPPYRPSMRRVYRDKWLRMHSLPHGKRLAADTEEKAELLKRHVEASNLLLGKGERCVLMAAYANGYSLAREPESVRRLFPTVIERWTRQWTDDERLAEELEDVELAVTQPFPWDVRARRDLIEDVAGDRTAPLLLLGLKSGAVYSPYDGGADLFFPRMSDRERARMTLAPWLSDHADGV